MKHTRLTFAAFVVLMVGLGSSDSLRGIFSPVFSSHFALSATQLGLIVTVSYIGNLVFLLVGGNVIERFEKKKALLALTGVWMAALAVFAFTDNYYLLLAGMFCAMGASTLRIIWKVIIPEAKPALITGAVISTVTILGYSAMAGTIGGGGLGQIAITYGYQKYDDQIVWLCVALTIIIVQILQEFGMYIARRTDRRSRT